MRVSNSGSADDYLSVLRYDVRGLLCGACNTGLGLLKDNPRTLRALAQYLDDYSERKDTALSACKAPLDMGNVLALGDTE